MLAGGGGGVRRLFAGLSGLALVAAAAGAVPASVPGLHVRGTGFQIGRFARGVQAFSNRSYVWEEVPAALNGWQFTRVGGGVRARITARADGAGAVFGICSPRGSRGLRGWRLVPQWRVRYNDATHSVLRVFYRVCRRAGPVPVPSGGWAGFILVAPRIRGEAMPRPPPDFSKAPGVVIDYSPAESTDYIGSPAIAILPDGRYVAAHDFFGPGRLHGRTRIFRSADRGRTWRRIADVPHQSFSNLFVHRGCLYLLGVGGRHGQVVLRRSRDGGRTWTVPRDARTGLLSERGGYHTAPTPVVEFRGRLWRALEDTRGPGRGWPAKFLALMISAPAGADLLDAASWRWSRAVRPNLSWLDGEFGGWLEGNAVVAPGGGIVDILRVHCYVGGKAACIHIGAEGRKAEFDPKTDFVDFPGGAVKFTIRFDPATRAYWALTNPVNEAVRAGRSAAAVRNTLALIRSKDLRHWTVRRIVLFHPDPEKHAFQYVDWQFDGDDIIAVARTAYDDGRGGANNYHNANFLTFHRIRNFRRAGGSGRACGKAVPAAPRNRNR